MSTWLGSITLDSRGMLPSFLCLSFSLSLTSSAVCYLCHVDASLQPIQQCPTWYWGGIILTINLRVGKCYTWSVYYNLTDVLVI